MNQITIEALRKEILAEVTSLIDTKMLDFLQMTDLQDLKEKFKQEKPLLVLYQDEREREPAEALISNELGFLAATYQQVENYANLDDEISLVLFYDPNKAFEQDLIESFLQETTYNDLGHTFIYYGDRLNCLLGYREICHAANSRFALYSRLLETFKYLELQHKKS